MGVVVIVSNHQLHDHITAAKIIRKEAPAACKESNIQSLKLAVSLQQAQRRYTEAKTWNRHCKGG
jgi:hypothetical protein